MIVMFLEILLKIHQCASWFSLNDQQQHQLWSDPLKFEEYSKRRVSLLLNLALKTEETQTDLNDGATSKSRPLLLPLPLVTDTFKTSHII